MKKRENEQFHIPQSRYVSIASMMTALALIGMYSLAGIPSVEFGTVVLFVTALLFGLKMGAICMLISAALYGSLNPWGGLIPQIWISQVLGWLVIVAVGSILGESGPKRKKPSRNRNELFILGAFLTAYFDAVTNLGYALAMEIPYVTAIMLGLPFTILHIASNAIIFAFAVPVLESTIRSTFGNDIWEPVIRKNDTGSTQDLIMSQRVEEE